MPKTLSLTSLLIHISTEDWNDDEFSLEGRQNKSFFNAKTDATNASVAVTIQILKLLKLLQCYHNNNNNNNNKSVIIII